MIKFMLMNTSSDMLVDSIFSVREKTSDSLCCVCVGVHYCIYKRTYRYTYL